MALTDPKTADDDTLAQLAQKYLDMAIRGADEEPGGAKERMATKQFDAYAGEMVARLRAKR